MPRDWNSAYENGDTPWDKGYAAPPLVEFLNQHRISGKVLVPGCGSGYDVRLLARQGADVTGLDIAPSALKKAEAFPVAAGECYVLGDFLNPNKSYLGFFDCVFEHTCLCAIEPSEREAYAQSLKSVLKPKGKVLAIFFREVPNYDGEGPPYPISAEEIDQLFTKDFEVIESYIPRQTYPSRPVGCEQLCWMQLRDG